MNRLTVRLAGLAGAALLVAGPLSAQSWTNWTSNTAGCDGGSANWCGTLSGVAVTYTGGFQDGQLSNGAGYQSGTDFWGPNTTAYTQGGLTNAPNTGGNPGFIQFDNPFSGTIAFSSPITNPIFAWNSIGADITVGVTFDQPFTVISDNLDVDVGAGNCPHWGCGTFTTSGNTLNGAEFSGVIEFSGTFSSISFSGTPMENWYGLQVGEFTAPSTTPEPATMTLLATGLVGLSAAAGRRRRNRKS